MLPQHGRLDRFGGVVPGMMRAARRLGDDFVDELELEQIGRRSS